MQICNAVAVAKLLNATLIIPHFHLNSVWKDPRCAFLKINFCELLGSSGFPCFLTVLWVFLMVFLDCSDESRATYAYNSVSFFFSFSAIFSRFRDIFDEEYFIESLSQQVRILRELPKEVMARYDNASMIYKVSKVKAWSLPRFYLENALPELKKRG